ncbi:MAG: hypothetical protein ABIQ88_12830 [Chitinophagaceae bacterium]
MKKKYGIILFLLAAAVVKTSAQTVVVTDDNAYTTGHASSVLDVKSTSKGFLAPRVTSAQKTAIASPAEGLLVFQTDGTKGFYFYAAGAWTMLSSGSASQWTSSGNNLYYSTGNVGIGLTSPSFPLSVKDTIEIRRIGAMSELLFSNTSGSGDLRIAGDGGDIFWQGGGGRNLQMGAYWGVILSGDRQTGVFPAFSNGVANTGVLVLAQRDASVPLGIQANSASQTANLTEWRSSAATLSVVDKNGNLGLGVTAPTAKLHVSATNPLTLNGVQTGAASDSLLTIASGIVRKLSFAAVTSAASWSLAGNTGTSSGTHFIGTTDNTSFKVKTNGTQRMVIDSLGNMGIGTAPAFTAGIYQEKLLVDAGTTNSYNAIVARGSINNYLQLNIQNQSSGTSASADIVATADNGNESVNFIDMGINSSSNTQNIMGAANDAYLYTTGNNLLLGTGTAAKSLVFLTGGTTQSTNERMRIDGSGNVGIGVTAPAQKLDISGNLKLSGAFMPGGTAGNANEFLVSGGSGAAPTWLNAGPFLSTIAWAKAGNSGTTSVTDFIGTTDYKSFKIRTNNTQGFILDSLGSVGVGANPAFTSGTNREEFLVDMGTTSSVNAIAGKGSIDSYLQLNIQNRSTGTSASSDVVATANNGSEITNYVDMGINGSNYSGGVMGSANDSYLYNVGQNFLIGTGTASKSLVFMTGGTTQSGNERMRIDGTGNVGIGVASPAALLDVSGTYKLGAAGTVLSNMIKTSVSISDATTFTYASTRQITVTVTGATVNATVIANPRVSLPTGIGIAWARVSAANTVLIGFTNTDGTARAVGAFTMDITLIQ